MKRLLLIPIWMSLGCGTASIQKTADKPAKVYSRSVSSQSLAHVHPGDCPKTLKGPEAFKRTDWKEFVTLANACVKAGRWTHVESFAEMLSAREPNAPWGVYYWALAAEHKNDQPRALWMIELALKKAPDLGLLHFQKGRLLWKDELYGPAMEELLKAVQLDGSLSEAHSFLGQIYFRDQEYAKATQHFYSVLKARPNDAIALSGLAESRLQSGDTTGALEAIKRAVAAYPERIEFALREAYIFETVLGDKAQALEAYRAALSVITSKRMKGPVASNVEKKIQELEKTTRQPSAVAERDAKKPPESTKVKQ